MMGGKTWGGRNRAVLGMVGQPTFRSRVVGATAKKDKQACMVNVTHCCMYVEQVACVNTVGYVWLEPRLCKVTGARRIVARLGLEGEFGGLIAFRRSDVDGVQSRGRRKGWWLQ